MSDKVLGGGMLLVAGFVFVYYTIWALFLPFIPASSPVQDLFPSREWAVRLPLFLLLTGMSGVGLFFARVTLSEARKKRMRAGKTA
ncbi:dolichyl-phosphate mannosyltransferase polypeptide 2, regulatory subunit [Tremella mesenterica]|uniref:Dolichol phosphate-mannose biosynthesis regulatory protein n=1 Tax=Tremella mesenterica TaxID=5217 RepID=A0A4V1M3N9_TREME|nr:dolichyl-phosphate mannosyltransferase polypeptide 2, regulatory subunit [Tremella mesenterica]